MNLKFYYTLSAVILLAVPCFAQTFKLVSPDKKTVVEINNGIRLQYTVSSNGLPSSILHHLGSSIISFTDTGSGLATSDTDSLISGDDKKFYWASARIEGNKVMVSSDKVAVPVADALRLGGQPGL